MVVIDFILIAVVAVMLVYSLGLFSIAKYNMPALFLALLIISSVVWGGFILLFLHCNNMILATSFMQVYYISAAAIPLSMQYFVSSYRKSRSSRFILAFSTIAFLGITVFVVLKFDSMIETVDIVRHTARVGLWGYSLYTLYFSITYLLSVYLLLRNIGKNSRIQRRVKQGQKLVLVVWLVCGAIGMTFNLWLPFVGNYSLINIGPLAILLFTGMTLTLTTTTAHFSPIKVFIKGVISFLSVSFPVVVSLALLLFLNRVFISDKDDIWIQCLFYVLSLIAGITIYWGFTKITKPLIQKTDFDGYDEAEVLNSMSQIASERHSLADFFRTVRHTLDKAFGVKFVDIIVFGQSTAVHVKDNKLEESLLRIAVGRNRYGAVYREDVRMKEDRTILVAHDIEVVVPIVGVIDNKVVGVIVLSPRKRRFDRYYGETLTKVSAVLSPFIQSAVFYEEISSFNEKLRHQVREKTQELRESNKELMKLDEMKDDLLSIASHNLRTPLTGIIGYADMLREGDFGKLKPAQQAAMEEVARSGKHMAQILGDFLDVTRIDSGRLTLKKESVNLTDLVAEEVANLQEMAGQYGRELVFESENKNIKMVGDESHMRQVVVNLMDNAIYYGRSKVEVRLAREDGRAVFTVKDDGIGVPKKEQGKLFTKMFRAENAKMTRPDGSGIGLYAVKNIIEGSGGEVIFESEEGVGSVFGFRI